VTSALAAVEPANETLVAAERLSRHFRLAGRWNRQVVRAVDDVSFAVRRGETFGLVGESGSGKSTLARLLLNLDRPTSGRVLFDGVDLARLSTRELRRLRSRMQMVFQDPFASLNRRRTARETIEFPLRVHRPELGATARSERVRELLGLVGLRATHAAAYPRELSGGQCQRVSIARALALNPDFVVLDEAVSAVDVSIQAQILNLLRDLQQQLGLTYLFVSHDLSVVRYMSNTIAVMYQGRIVEHGARERLFATPRHPCTHALLASIPTPDPEAAREQAEGHVIVREEVAGAVEVLGCRFHPRCPLGSRERCRVEEPLLEPLAVDHLAACHFPQSAESLKHQAELDAAAAR
jgi:oligopeptide/dipeptide ABC transporter ATP-binding protein